jgi:hypothetical protein
MAFSAATVLAILLEAFFSALSKTRSSVRQVFNNKADPPKMEKRAILSLFILPILWKRLPVF